MSRLPSVSRVNRTGHVIVTKSDPAANDGVTACASCVVCGGPAHPKEDRLCTSCRDLAATFARATQPRSFDDLDAMRQRGDL